MKRFFTRNRKLVEIFLTLGLVFLVAGYYYFIYIPAREDEIVARRFRTLQRIERNMQEKFQGYQQTMKNCLTRADESFFDEIVKGYNSDTNKFHITVLNSVVKKKSDSTLKRIIPILVVDTVTVERKVRPSADGKKLTMTNEWYKLQRNDSIWHISIIATIDYKEFVMPLLKKGVFDHYIVFNVHGDTSNVIYEDFPSGISFKRLDSLFNTNNKIYTSRITKIETGGEKYLAFLHPCGYNNKNDRIVAGLLKQETFDKEKRRLPENIVTTILFISLFCLLLLPVIRLALMGKKERIRFVDLFTGYFAFLLLVPVIILVFFWNNEHFLSSEANNADSKQVLADKIAQSLNNEIDSAYTLLDKIDSIRATSNPDLDILDTINVRYINSKAKAHFFERNKHPNSNRIDSMANKLDSVLKANLTGYKNTEFIFWMDATGREISNWAFEEDPPRGNYKTRKYFKNVEDNHVISLVNNSTKYFAIEPLVSRTDGKFKIAIAKKSRTDGFIVASASRFYSVINPVLPLGFEFSIIDEEGNTIFDSDTTENLNENLLEEFVNDAPLKVALDTKTSMEFKTHHEDDEFNVLAQPIAGLPYHIVILEKQAFNSSLYTQSLSFTMVMMFSFFLFLCFEMCVILIANYQSTKLQKNSFDFSWIYPRKNLTDKYFSLFLTNTAVLIVLALFCFINFSIERLTEYIFLFIMATLITSITAFAFKAEDAENESIGTKKLQREKLAIKLLSGLAIIVLIAAYNNSVLVNILIFSAISILICIGLSKAKTKIRDHIKSGYMTNFRLVIFSRLLLTSGLPVVVFFNCIYNFEQRLEKRLTLLNYAKNIEQHAKNGEKLHSILDQLNSKNTVRRFYTDFGWVNPHVGSIGSLGDIKSYSKEQSVCINLLKTSRLHYNDVSGNTENFELIKPFGGGNAQFAFNSILNDSVDVLNYKVTEMVDDKAASQYITLSSGLYRYAFPSITMFPEGPVFWIMLFICLGIGYILLVYATNKVFGENIPDIEELKEVHKNLLVDEKIKYLFVQGMPGAGKSTFIKNNLEAGKKFTFYDVEEPPTRHNAKFFNLSEIPEAGAMAEQKEVYDKEKNAVNPDTNNWFYKEKELIDKEMECIVFTHFEYKIFDEFTNNIKLSLIEKVIGIGKKKIIISSNIDPVEYFYSLKKFMLSGSEKTNNKLTAKNDNGKEAEPGASSYEFVNQWSNLLGRFTNIYMNVEKVTAPNDTGNSFSTTFLTAECSNPAFLNNYKPQFETFPIDEKNEEDYILKIQSLCDHSYRQIWSSLTKEEQLTLYDLAEDGLVNTTNYISLTMLLNKGLVIKDANGVLMVINRSFRNFILTVVNSDDIKCIEKEINDEHTWNDYKYPVFIVLGALLYFVLSSNPEKFGNLLPVITGVLTGIPTIIKMLSFLRPVDAKG